MDQTIYSKVQFEVKNELEEHFKNGATIENFQVHSNRS